MLDVVKIKKYYNAGVWSKLMVANAVVKGVITGEQYQEITGDAYHQ